MKNIKVFEGFFDKHKSEHNWEVAEATRKDGQTFYTGDQVKDGNGSILTIKVMYISENGRLMAEFKEGGAMDLFNAKYWKSH
jgi:hypothetical protein